MKRAGTKSRVLISLFLAFAVMGAYFILVYQRIPFIYEINDDVAMRNVAAGAITGEPDAHLIHMKYILGLFISGLYRAFPGTDWYGLTLIGVMLVSFAVVLYRGFVSERSLLWKGGYTLVSLLLVTCLGLQHITDFQWTVTAAAAGSAGIYLFYTSEASERFQIIVEEGLSVLLILVSLLIRDDVFLMILPVAGLCYCWKYLKWSKKGKIPFTLRHVGVPAGLLCGVLLILGTEAFAYRSPEWREFLSYNKDREAIMDYYGIANYEDDSEFYDSLGLTPEEVENMQRYSLYLVDDLYSEKMAAIAKRSRELYVQQHSVKDRLVDAAETIYEHWGKDTYRSANLICLAAAAVALGYCYGKDKKQFWLAGFILAGTMLYWLYLGYRHRILERVGFALYFLVIFSMSAIWYRSAFLEKESQKAQTVDPAEGSGQAGKNRQTEESGQRWFLKEKAAGVMAWAASCAVLTLLAFNIWNGVKDNNTWRTAYNDEFLDVNSYMAEHMENVYFMTTFTIETYTDNFRIHRDFPFTNLLSVGGWHTFSPLENEKDRELGITDPKTDIVKKDNVYVISIEYINLRYMDRYYTSVYGDDYLGRELVDTLDYGERVFEIYDFSVKEH